MSRAGEDVVVADAAAVAEEAARRFAAAAEEAIAARGRFHVALAGGSTPRATYERLARAPYREGVDWSRVSVWFGDERTVPPEHPESNYGMARRALLAHVPLDLLRVHRMEGERVPAEAARDYEERLRAEGPRESFTIGECAFPRLDLVHLGMGPDGHSASLFPHTAALGERRRLVVANHVEKLATWRITMTAPLLCAARAVLFLVAGAEKAPVLRAIAAGPDDPEEHPVLLVRPANGTLTWLLDRAAIS